MDMCVDGCSAKACGSDRRKAQPPHLYCGSASGKHSRGNDRKQGRSE